MTRKRTILITFPILLIISLYFLGPAPNKPAYNAAIPDVPKDPASLENYIAEKEKLHKLKPENEAAIIWADSSRQRTPYAVVYIHGFSASQKEGDPVHKQFAKEFGCNLYLPRLSDHGVDT